MPIWSPHGRVTMTITSLRSQPVLLLAVAMLLCSVGQVTCQEQSDTQSPAQVLQDLLARYGDNSTITVPQLRSLLALLSQSQSESSNNGGDEPKTTTTVTPPKTNSSKVRTVLYLWHNGFLRCVSIMGHIDSKDT